MKNQLIAIVSLATLFVPATFVQAAASKPIPYGEPVKIEISRVGIRAAIEKVTISDRGILQAPRNPNKVGWYRNGAIPGKRGNAFMYGHLNTTRSTAIFWKLRNVRVGDIVVVTNDKGQRLKFRVTSRQVYARNAAPLRAILGSTSKRRLNLMTCAGTWSSRERNYSHRLVVYTELI